MLQFLGDHNTGFGGVRQNTEEPDVLNDDDESEALDHRLLAVCEITGRMGVDGIFR